MCAVTQKPQAMTHFYGFFSPNAGGKPKETLKKLENISLSLRSPGREPQSDTHLAA